MRRSRSGTAALEITVSDNLVHPHRLSKASAAALAHAHVDQNGIKRVRHQQGCLDIRVSEACIDRALRIVNALAVALESRGHRIVFDKVGRFWETRAVVADEPVSFHLRETLRRIEHVPTARERESAEVSSYDLSRRFDYRPTGHLVLEIDPVLAAGLRKKWADTSRQKLEDILGKFVLGLETIAESESLRRTELQATLRAEEIQREALLNEQERLRAVEREVSELREMAYRWRDSEVVREFVRAVEESAEARLDVGQWAKRARDLADRLDPASNGEVAQAMQPTVSLAAPRSDPRERP